MLWANHDLPGVRRYIRPCTAGNTLFAIHRAFQLALVKGASDAAAATVQDVAIDHGRGEIRVAEEFLNRAGVVAVLEEMGRERVSKSVGACRFRNSGREHGLPYRTLQGTLVQKMPAALATLTMGVVSCRWKDPLPSPFAGRVWVFPGERVGQFDETGALPEVTSVLSVHAPELVRQGLQKGFGQHGNAVLFSLAVAYGELAAFKIHVFDACCYRSCKSAYF